MSGPNNPGQKLKFRIVDFSGEDPEYPVTELLAQSPQSRGWQSPRFCDWPQYITLQFVSPVKLKQLQFLSHQCKVASKVELYTAFPDLKSAMPNLDLKFKKMGYLSLDPNERSGFQSRELKTVYVDAPCLYLKIVFQKCHVNKYNLFNQVGLIAFGAFGETLSKDKENNKPEANPKYEKLEYEMQFDNDTLKRLKDLEDAKSKAVKNEEFDEAKRLKEAIDRLKHIGAQLQHLEERKTIAIQNEDYDSAKIIKQEIERLREAVAPSNLVRRKQPVQQYEEVQQQPKYYQEQQQQQDPNEEYYRRMHEEQSQKQQPEEFKNESIHITDTQQQKQNNKNLFEDQDGEDRPLPALQNKTGGQYPVEEDAQGGGGTGSAEAEFLTGENAKLAEPLIPIITDELARKLFSKQWNQRDEGIKIIEAEARLESRSKVLNFQDPFAAFVALMGCVSYTINDRVIQVAQKSMNLLQTILGKEPQKSGSRNELNAYIETIMGGLLEKIGDNNPRVREQAEQVYILMVRSPVVTCSYCVQALVKSMPTGTKHKTSSSTRHVLARLGLLREIIQEFGINNQNVPYSTVVNYVVDKLENSNPDIRQAAFNIIIDMYSVVGEKLKGDLSGVRPQHLEMLQEEFDKVSGNAGGGGGGGNYGSQKNDPIVTTNINPHGATNKKAGGGTGIPTKKQAKGSESNKAPTSGDAGQANAPVCEFCGRKDRNFADSGKLDIHLWRECPMLTTCPNCAQIVEISTLNGHLLDECEMAKVMRKCPRCKEAIHMDEFKQHTDEMSCNQFVPPDQANRCPLCHQDIKPGEIGWKSHLLYEGCPNNDRTL